MSYTTLPAGHPREHSLPAAHAALDAARDAKDAWMASMCTYWEAVRRAHNEGSRRTSLAYRVTKAAEAVEKARLTAIETARACREALAVDDENIPTEGRPRPVCGYPDVPVYISGAYPEGVYTHILGACPELLS